MTTAYRRKKPGRVPSNADPAVRALFEAMEEQGTTMFEVAIRTEIHYRTLDNWRYEGKDPGVSNLRAALNSIGLDLTVTERKE